MKAVQFNQFGNPADVVHCVELPDVGAPAADEVVIRMEAFPVNPADLLTLEGRYATRPVLPATLGAEGVGIIDAVGDDVADLKVGDRVLPLGRDNWVAVKKEPAARVIKLPDMDPLQASMLKVNPATALFLLHNYELPAAGDMLIQNAANSAVGLNVIRLAEDLGVKTINIVRRAELVPVLRDDYGASHVLVDDADIVERVEELSAGHTLRLGLDAIGGQGTRTLSKCVQDGGTIVNYGFLCGEPCTIDPHELVFRQISLAGFWLAKLLTGLSRQELTQVYARLAALVARGTLRVPIEKTYSIDDIKIAVEHAARTARAGKIVVLPNA